MLKIFDSLEHFLDVCAELNINSNRYNASAWEGGQSSYQTYEYARHGNDTLVADAEKLMFKLETELSLKAYRWVDSVVGAFPVIPNYLANSPTPMRLRKKEKKETTPVNVYVSTTSSGGINAEDMSKRGTAILALLMALERVRPIHVSLLVELDGREGFHKGCTIGCIPIPSNPLQLGVACHVLTSAGFARHLTYHWAGRNGMYGGWPEAYYTHHESDKPNDPKSPYSLWLRDYIGMQPQDLYIKPPHSKQDILKDPVKWLNDTIASYTKLEGEL